MFLGAMAGAHPPGQETEPQRVNRELIELLNELRVALPGVQVLFAFLLALPFSSAFDDASTFERDVYFATLSCSALASALLIAPSAVHRLNFRSPDKSRIVFVSNGLTIAGLGVLALTMTAVMLLISHLILSSLASIIVTAVSASGFTVLWLALPLWERRETHR